jgi:hypothetical protein
LGAGETATVSFNVQVIDNSGTDTATSLAQTVTLTLGGSNDKPSVTDVTVAAVAEEAGETTGVQVIHTGDLDVTDIDTNDAHTFTVWLRCKQLTRMSLFCHFYFLTKNLADS